MFLEVSRGKSISGCPGFDAGSTNRGIPSDLSPSVGSPTGMLPEWGDESQGTELGATELGAAGSGMPDQRTTLFGNSHGKENPTCLKRKTMENMCV